MSTKRERSLTPARPAKRQTSIDAAADVVDEIFAQFELVYPAAFQRAFAEAEKLKMAKRLWLQHLGDQPPQRLRRALRNLIRNSPYLPNLHEMLEHCRNERFESMPKLEPPPALDPEAALEWTRKMLDSLK